MRPRVLFVDDEDGVRNAIRRIFQYQQEFEVDFAASGKEALEKMRDHEFHIIVSDHLMPEMRGDQLLDQVRKEFPDSIRLILTAYGTLDLATKAMNELGVLGFLQKPIKKKELIEVLRKAAARYQENSRIQQLVQRYDLDIPPSELIENLWLILAEWDERFGPKVVESYPHELPGVDAQRIAVQTFMGFPMVYGHEGTVEPSQLTLPIHYLKSQARVHFDAREDSTVRGGHRKFAIIVITPTMKGLLIEIVDSCTSDFATVIREKKNVGLISLFQCLQRKIETE